MAESYVSPEEYAALFPGEEISEERLAAASAHVDGVTFGRIRAMGGLDALTEFQQAAVKEAVCRQAKFEAENTALYSFSMAAYAINGVSMKSAQGEGVYRAGGVTLGGEARALLSQTGLMARSLGGTS